MRPGGLRTGALAAACVVLLLGTVWLLDRFARHEFSMHLRDQAAHALALAATAGTPYVWHFKAADDLVAGQVFDAARFAFADGDLRIEPRIEGLHPLPFEFGVPLPRPVDVKHFPHLRIAFDADMEGELRIVVREKLHGPALTSSAVMFGAGHHDASTDLQAVPWSPDNGTGEIPAPQSAAMIRIRVVPGRPGTMTLRSVALERPTGFVPLDLQQLPHVVDPGHHADGGLPVYRLSASAAEQQRDIARIGSDSGNTAAPLILLPQRGRVEQQIALRNAVFAELPNAILIPENRAEDTFNVARELVAAGRARSAASTQWRIVAAFAAILVLARFRSPRNPRWRALLEIALTLAAPAWLILGGNYDGSLHTPQTVMIAIGLIYAVSLSLPRVWHWNGSAQAWLGAGLVVGMALAIAMALHGSDNHLDGAPGVRQIVRYLGWALLQQYLICAVCTERWHLITGNAYAATYLGALGFALLHTPNAALMLATFVGGLCWCALYLRERALLPLAISHAASALLLSALLPREILHSAEVSVRFFQ